MAVSNYRVLQAFTAGADLTSATGCAIELNSSGQAVLATAATDAVIGILVDGGPNGAEEVGVCCEHGVKVPARTSAAIAAGALVGVVAGGKIATASGASIGVALEASTAADQYITILYLGKTAA